MLGLKPITLLPARERVAAALRKAIIAKQIKAGEVLTLEKTARAPARSRAAAFSMSIWRSIR